MPPCRRCRYPAAYVPPETSSGSLAYAPDHMHLGQAGLHVSEDRPAAPDKTGAETMWFNIAYEKVGGWRIEKNEK